MLSYASGISSLPLLGETIGENLRRTVDDHGDAEALVVPHQEFRATYRQLWDQVSRAARGLLARGVTKGDRVGIWAPNRFEWVVVQFATARIGAILVNINPAYRTTELRVRAAASPGVSFLLLARAFRQTDYVGMLADVKGACPELREAVVLEDGWESLLRDGRAISRRRARGGGGRRCSATTRSTSSTRPAPPAFPRARPSRTTTSSTTASSSARRSGTRPRTASAFRCPSITASGWCSATSPARRTARASSFPARPSSPPRCCAVTQAGALHVALRRADDVHRRAGSPRLRRRSTSAICAPASWPAPRARSR